MLAIKKKREREREQEKWGENIAYTRDHQQRQHGMNGLLDRQFGWQGGARKQPQRSSEQSILSYHITIVWHNIHYPTQRPELVDLCCRMFAGLWIVFAVHTETCSSDKKAGLSSDTGSGIHSGDTGGERIQNEVTIRQLKYSFSLFQGGLGFSEFPPSMRLVPNSMHLM